MRDPKRISMMLEALREAWSTYPDVRLGQIISNLAKDDEDIFYVEDDVLYERLKNIYDK